MIDRPLYYNAETEKWFERYLACIKRIEAAEKVVEAVRGYLFNYLLCDFPDTADAAPREYLMGPLAEYDAARGALEEGKG